MPIRILELFSGTGSVSKYCSKFPGRYEVTSLDIQAVGDFTPTHVANILDFPYREHWQPGQFQFLWASPPCTQFSLARTKAKTPRDLEGADALVAKTLEIIHYLEPDAFCIENPLGLLRRREVVAGLPCFVTDYCQFGMMYKKPSCIWTDLYSWVPKRCSAECPALIPGTRCHRVQMSGTKSKMNAEQIQCPSESYYKGRIPEPLIAELLACAAREHLWDVDA